MNDASSIGSEYTAFGHGPTSSIQHEAPMASDEPAITQGKQRVRRDQRAAMLDHLIRNIDIMIYAQLSILYYMEYVLLHCQTQGRQLSLSRTAARYPISSFAHFLTGSTSLPSPPFSLLRPRLTAHTSASSLEQMLSACCYIFFSLRLLLGKR